MGASDPNDAFRGQRLFAKLSSVLSDAGSQAGSAPPAEGAASASQKPTQKTKIQEARQPSSCSYAEAAAASPSPLGATSSSTCPMAELAGAGDFNPATGMPSSLSNTREGAAPRGASPAGPALGTNRMLSTIPMAPLEASTLPKHQLQDGSGAPVAAAAQTPGKWMYPSEQMFYNAMKRKGWDPNAEDMAAVVAIHNSVNERAWREVMAWERMHCSECAEPKLKKFMGRPSDYSPKARFLNLMGFALPFDRHDWIVDRCGKDVRYVIDFYNAPVPTPGVPAAMFLDVRPALDSVESIWDRISMQFRWMSSGRWKDE